MKSVAIVLVLLSSALVQAQIKPYAGKITTPNSAYKQMYLVGGKESTAEQAFSGAIAGKEVYNCVKQEISMGKSGKSAGLKNIKKNQ